MLRPRPSNIRSTAKDAVGTAAAREEMITAGRAAGGDTSEPQQPRCALRRGPRSTSPPAPTAPAAVCGSSVPRPRAADRARAARRESESRSPRRSPADQSTVHRPRENRPQEEHQARRITTPELSVDRQTQRVPIKPVAPLRFGRMKQDAAPNDFLVLHPSLEPGTSLGPRALNS